ncbi:MAG: NifU family protein [Planctomycetales bacterium]|nr:NifU family protein [Planctomycetales bacterium]
MALDKQQVLEALDEIRHFLQADGGDCELVGVEGNNVLIHLVGACSGCSSSTMTLTSGIENHLRDRFPDLEALVPV